jgi:hypothetical protein
MLTFILIHGDINESQLCNPRIQIATDMYWEGDSSEQNGTREGDINFEICYTLNFSIQVGQNIVIFLRVEKLYRILLAVTLAGLSIRTQSFTT